MWFVYILSLKDGTLYTGITNNIDKRMKKHASGKGSKYVRSRLPLSLVYVEAVINKSIAAKREFKIKQLKRKDKIRLIDSNICISYFKKGDTDGEYIPY